MEFVDYTADALTITASVAIAIAGFSGVVVALTGRTTESFGEVERLNLRILLQVSSVALLFSMVPLVLHNVFESFVAWRVAMFVYGSVHLADAGYFFLRTRAGAVGAIKIKGMVAWVPPWIGVGIAVTQLLLAVLGPIAFVKTVYLLVLIFHLAIAGSGFLNIVFASREETEN
jgi:hypothetical protein